jgi:hypothetical protein
MSGRTVGTSEGTPGHGARALGTFRERRFYLTAGLGVLQNTGSDGENTASFVGAVSANAACDAFTQPVACAVCMQTHWDSSQLASYVCTVYPR